MTDDVVDLIDGALRDYQTSRDAMRHVPGDQRAERPPVAWPLVIHHTTGGMVAAPRPFALRLNPEAVRQLAGIQVRFAAVALAFGRAYLELGRRLNQQMAQIRADAVGFAVNYARLARVGIKQQDGPPPLCVDGREYHRRQQARRRRR